MGDSHEKKKPYVKTILLGIIVAIFYAVLLTNQDAINQYFSRGGMFAFLPIAAAFIFSFAHGSFTGNFWTSLGIEAKKKREGK